MPENASTRTIDRDRLRSRLVSPRSTGKTSAGGAPSETAKASGATPRSEFRLDRPAPFDQSPVLFRLPAIAPVESHGAVAASEALRSEQFRSPQSEASEVRCDDEVTLDIAHVAPPIQVQSPSPQTPSSHSSSQLSSGQSELREPSAEDVVNQPQVASSVAMPPVESAQVEVAAPAVEANSEQRRTWWEHWSSGVVLILLVVALVVASIIALNDGGKIKSNQMAGQLEASMLDEFDLSSITIPDISMPPLNATPARPLSTVAQNSPAPADTARTPTPIEPVSSEPVTSEPAALEVAAVDQAPSENTTVEAIAVDKSASATTVADRVAVDSTAGEAVDRAVGAEAVVDLAAKGGGIALELAGPAVAELAAQATPESIPPLPLATLDRPTEVAAPQLFAPQELPGEVGLPTGNQRISSLPASSPTVSLELPQAETKRVEGSSPTFYDGASVAGGQHTVSGPSVSSATGGLTTPANNSAYGPHSYGPISSSAVGPIDTNMPDISTVLASATASVGSGDAPAAQVVKSATPDLNRESLVEEFLRFQQLHQATTGPASNRYPNPPLPR